MTTTDAALAGVTNMSRDEAKRFYMETYGVDAAEAERMLMISHPRYRVDTVVEEAAPKPSAPRRYKGRASPGTGGEYAGLPVAAKARDSH